MDKFSKQSTLSLANTKRGKATRPPLSSHKTTASSHAQLCKQHSHLQHQQHTFHRFTRTTNDQEPKATNLKASTKALLNRQQSPKSRINDIPCNPSTIVACKPLLCGCVCNCACGLSVGATMRMQKRSRQQRTGARQQRSHMRLPLQLPWCLPCQFRSQESTH